MREQPRIDSASAALHAMVAGAAQAGATTRAGWPDEPPPRRIAIRTGRTIAIVPVDSIIRLAADDNYVVIHADRAYRHKCTLAALCDRLDPRRFLRIHRSHAVNVGAVCEMHALARRELRLVLRDGTSLHTGRRYAAQVASACGLG